MKLLMLPLLIFATSCSILSSRNQERTIQTKVIEKLTAKSEHFESCAINSDLFKKQKTDRIRITLDLIIGQNGELEKFSTSEAYYPEKFTDCLFNIVDQIKFPKLNEGTTLSLTQPFIFVQR